MLPLIAGAKWLGGAIATGVLGNWVSQKIGIGTEEGVSNPIPTTHWEKYGMWYVSATITIIGAHTLYTMYKRKKR